MLSGNCWAFIWVGREAKKVTYRLDIKRTINRKLVLGIADGTVEVDGKVIYEAKDLKVGLFENPRSL